MGPSPAHSAASLSLLTPFAGLPPALHAADLLNLLRSRSAARGDRRSRLGPGVKLAPSLTLAPVRMERPFFVVDAASMYARAVA